MCCMSATPAPIGFAGDRLTLLTTDHVREGTTGGGRSNILTRALGVEAEVRLDYATQPLALHDRFLLCSDGVHGTLSPEAIADILRERSASDDTARALVKAALDAGTTDNCTAMVIDVVELPTAESTTEIGTADHAAAADPGADRRRSGRRLSAQGAGVRRPLQPPVRRRRRDRRRRGGAEISQAASRGGRHLSRGLRARGLGRRAGAKPVGWPHHRAAAGAADLLSTPSCRSIRASCCRRGSRAARRWDSRRGATSRSSSPAASRRCTAPASSIATSSPTT